MKTPKTIKAYAVIDKEKMKLKALDIFKDKDVSLLNGEIKCKVEIKFVKFIK